MPTYVYECESDKTHTYEKMQRFSDPTDSICPVCGGAVHRVISGGVGLIFNGKGFYQTDYKGGNASIGPSRTNKAESESDTTTKTTEAKTTDAKPTGGCGAGCSCHN